ncbi:MAG TPA: Gfo/Idh/MocA family oxidoreductase [Solirubrobacteraceae bacterium]|nr:Gfo/Idh/MocA family oxidoreductase [Solirubrobacteraceae bacterium]
MASTLRAGIAGSGFIGAVHARSARRAGARITAVAASSPESAQTAARALGAERAFASAAELVEDPDIDVVHICTPNHLHLPLAEAALAAGKHVICEKPLALDAAGARRLVEAAAGTGLQAAVPFVYRYYPTVREARQRVRDESTGDLRLLHGAYLQDWLLRPEDDNWRVDATLGGRSRAFADIGSHWCDLAQFISGHRITRLSARLLTALPGRATEDAAVVLFETDAGALGTVTVSQISAGRKNQLSIELDGADEALAFDQEYPEELWCGRRESATIIRRDPLHLSPDAARFATLPPGHPQGYADCFDSFVADVYDAIACDAPSEGLPSFDDGLRAALITDAVLASAASESWVDVAEAEALAR